mmetsp:Transcript_23932/g.36447  ORF Transcript_23932/g.36447 Transcript_23932/m.36447 type:complete len:122 (-) Transcript_23932:582-947(-)
MKIHILCLEIDIADWAYVHYMQLFFIQYGRHTSIYDNKFMWCSHPVTSYHFLPRLANNFFCFSVNSFFWVFFASSFFFDMNFDDEVRPAPVFVSISVKSQLSFPSRPAAVFASFRTSHTSP